MTVTETLKEHVREWLSRSERQDPADLAHEARCHVISVYRLLHGDAVALSTIDKLALFFGLELCVSPSRIEEAGERVRERMRSK